jgi:hypothetical protein
VATRLLTGLSNITPQLLCPCFFLRRSAFGFGLLAVPFEALTQRIHKIDDIAARRRLFLRNGDDAFSLGFLLDQLDQSYSLVMEIMRYSGELKAPQTYFHDLPT